MTLILHVLYGLESHVTWSRGLEPSLHFFCHIQSNSCLHVHAAHLSRFGFGYIIPWCCRNSNTSVLYCAEKNMLLRWSLIWNMQIPINDLSFAFSACISMSAFQYVQFQFTNIWLCPYGSIMVYYHVSMYACNYISILEL